MVDPRGGWHSAHVTRDEAAALLGVPADAAPDAVRRAWRTWARLAHPDAGGDPAHFTRLHEAREVLLRQVPQPMPAPAPRPTWREVLHAPDHPRAVIGLGLVAIGSGALAPILDLGFASVACAALLGAVAAVVLTRALLLPTADAGHRIAMLALTWAPIVAGQLVVSSVLGTSLVPVLPILAVPLVAAVSAVNPGAGLWRPVRFQAPSA